MLWVLSDHRCKKRNKRKNVLHGKYRVKICMPTARCCHIRNWSDWRHLCQVIHHQVSEAILKMPFTPTLSSSQGMYKLFPVNTCQVRNWFWRPSPPSRSYQGKNKYQVYNNIHIIQSMYIKNHPKFWSLYTKPPQLSLYWIRLYQRLRTFHFSYSVPVSL